MDIETSYITEEKMPLVVRPKGTQPTKEAFFAFLKEKESWIREQLLKDGAVLLRDFPVESADDFDEVLSTLHLGATLDYVGGDSPRNRVKGNIFTSTEMPASMTLPLHNELSFVEKYPKHICFYCDVEPTDRGQTTIGDARKIYDAIDPEVKKRFVDRNLMYVSRYYAKSTLLDFINKFAKGHKTWMEVFQTEDKAEVERRCAQGGFSVKWHRGDWAEVSQTRPAILKHPETGEMVWFNQVHLYDCNPKFLGWGKFLGTKMIYLQKHTKIKDAYFGDGVPIPKKDIYHVLDVLDQQSVYFSWKKGDVLILDNILAMHGRAPFTGKRRVLTAMTD